MKAKTISQDGKLWARIAKIRQEFCYGNNTEFATKTEINTSHASGICSGAKVAGAETLEKILSAFPSVNRSWLYFGEGPMLKEGAEVKSENVEQRKVSKEDDLRARVDEQSATIRTLQSYISMLEKRVAELESEISKG